jgi:FAD/FMN-containing dehydrogenase
MLFFRRMSMAHQNWRALEVEPRQILGSAVHFDTAHRPVYASDASNYRQVPIGVVTPRSMEDFIRGVAICERQQAPVLVRGGDALQCHPRTRSGRRNRASRTGRRLRFAAGCRENHGLTFAPDPSTHSRCTIGGMVANNSCGPHSVMAGKTLENVEALEVLTYDGARFWVGPTTDLELEAIIREGGRKGKFMPRCAPCASATPT